MKKRLIAILLLLAILAAFSGCQKYAGVTGRNPKSPAPSNQPADNPKTGESTSLSLVAVGDNLLHAAVIRAAKTDKGYDFAPMYAPVREMIEGADVAFVNQEAPMAGGKYAPSGYPNFNAPQEAGRDLIKVGFDVINEANNHSMDKGAKAVVATADFWADQKDALMVGMYRSEAEREKNHILEKNRIKLGFLSYSYGTNGIPIPQSQPYLIPLIDKERISADIERLRPECDLLIVSMHWGTEYQLAPSDEQQELAKYLTSLGVDLIIGHHPHVVQRAEWVEAENGKRAFCVYSLGNFVSSQEKRNTMLGAMLEAKIEKTADGKTSVKEAGVRALVTHYESGATGGKNYRVYPLSEYTETLAAKHAINVKRYDKGLTVSYLSELAKKIFGALLITE